MDEVKAAMERENSAANYPPSSRRSSEDGDQTKELGHNHYQDSGHGSNDEKSDLSHHQRKPSGKIAVNFASAKQRQKSKITAGKTKKRGDELLTMIRLDVAKYDMFDLPPIAYEGMNDFLKIFLVLTFSKFLWKVQNNRAHTGRRGAPKSDSFLHNFWSQWLNTFSCEGSQ